MGFGETLVQRLLRSPWFVPSVQPIELFFFQRIFYELCRREDLRQRQEEDEDEDEGLDAISMAGIEVEEDQEVPLVAFQRAMVRLFRVIKDNRKFDASDYDRNSNARVGWFEFCSLWKDRGIHVRLTLAERIFLTMEDAERSILGKIWSVLIFIAILVSTGSLIVSTMPEVRERCVPQGMPGFDVKCRPKPKAFFNDIDLVCVILFTVEYIVRLVLSAFMRTELVDSDKTLLLKWMISDDAIKVPTRLNRMMHWALNWSNIIDLAAIIPWYLDEIIASVNGGQQDQGVVLKILRLTRVIRAFRLGRRFEAVIIIVRSVRRSIRALYVLVLNLFLGMVIFGALMYFAEQGEWDPNTLAYVRWEDPTFQNRSPFDSIPACFWWVIVTATTVGYGDDHTPTTAPGKLVAGLTMVWSLCVLALPIGVIGGNFSEVWEEYDTMKEKEAQMRVREEAMLKRSTAWGNPLHHSRELLIEVWHDAGLMSDREDGHGDPFQCEFLGEVEYLMDLPADEAVTRRCCNPLTANHEKARRKVSGMLTFEYSWQPVTHTLPDAVLQGRLEVKVVKAESLLNIDWKGNGVSDPYCIVIANPNSPSDLDGILTPVRERTKTIWDTTKPVFNETVSFNVCWTKEESKAALVADMRQISREISKPIVFSLSGSARTSRLNPSVGRVGSVISKQSDKTPVSEVDVNQAIPTLEGEVERLKTSMPQLQREISQAQRDMQFILNALRSRRQQSSCWASESTRAAFSTGSLSPGVGESRSLT